MTFEDPMPRRSSPLVSTRLLGEYLKYPSIVLLDASIVLDSADIDGTPSFDGDSPYRLDDGRILVGTKIFRTGLQSFEQDGHIPSARYANLLTEFSDLHSTLPFTLPSTSQFEQAAGRLGISADSHVIIYDRFVGQWAARLWWIFSAMGHGKVSVLDGGLRKYLAEGGPMARGASRHDQTAYACHGAAPRLACKQDVINILEKRRAGSFVCFLQPDDYSGKVLFHGRSGHIPGSVNLPFRSLVDEKTNALLSVELLRERISAVVPLDGNLIVSYCGGGIASTLGALALAVIGYKQTLQYDGSLAEWMSDPDLPLEN